MATETVETNGIPPVGPRVRALREAEGLSLRDLAERSGVSAPMLSQVERGETSPTLAVAGRIAAQSLAINAGRARIEDMEIISTSSPSLANPPVSFAIHIDAIVPDVNKYAIRSGRAAAA